MMCMIPEAELTESGLLLPGEKILLPANGSAQYNLYGITPEGVAYLSYLGA
jgi:hypothetical protein